MKRLSYRIIFFIILFGNSLSLSSQTNDSIAYDIPLEDVIVTAHYKPTDINNVLYNVDVINEKLIAARGATQLDQALLISPLIRLEQDMVLGPKIKLKGIDSRNVAILIDGVPIIGRLDGALDLNQIPMQNVQKIEIVQGPLSNIYGNNAAGGVINIITKKSQLNTANVAIEGHTESVGIKNLQSTIGIQNEKFRFAISGRLFEYDRYPVDSLRVIEKISLPNGSTQLSAKYPWNPKNQNSLGASLLYRLNDANSLTIKYDISNETVDDYDQIRRPTFKPYSNDNTYTTKRNDVALFYNGLFKNKNYLDITIAKNTFNRITEDKRYYHETASYDSLLYNADSIKYRSYYSRLNFARELNSKLELMSGITFTHDIARGDRIISRENADTSQASFYEYAVYAELKYKLISCLQLMTSGRHTVNSIYNGKFTPTFQLKYDIVKNLSLRASYSQGYRSPDLKELFIEFIDINHFIIGNTKLKPETSIDNQFTLDYTKDNTNINIGFYHTVINDKISLVEINPPLEYQYLNFDRFIVYGLQSGFNINIKNINLNTSANLGYWSTGINSEDVPAFGEVFDINNTFNYLVPKTEINIFINHRYSGKQPNYSIAGDKIYINTLQDAHYVDASINKSFLRKKINVTIGVKNISDVKLLRIDGSIGGIHQGSGTRPVNQGRSFFASLKFNL